MNCVCGVPDGYIEALLAEEARGGLPRWGKPVVTWALAAAVPPFSFEETAQVFAAAWAKLQAACGIVLRRAERNADITMTVGGIDGPGGTLAWSEIPPGDDRPLRQKYDTAGPSLRWDAPRLLLTAMHEGGHALGLPHGPAGSLMQPTLNTDIDGPQSWDVAQLQQRYGPPRPAQPDPPEVPETPPGDDDIRILVSGAVGIRFDPTGQGAATIRVPRAGGLKLSIPGYRVTPE